MNNLNIKTYIGLGILISFVVLSSVFGYKLYQGISSTDVALAVKISFITIFILSLLLIGALTTFCIYYFAMKTTVSTIAKNINSNEKSQELSAELAKKALDTTIAISNYNHHPTVNLSLPTKQGTEKEAEDEKVIKLHQWEKG